MKIKTYDEMTVEEKIEHLGKVCDWLLARARTERKALGEIEREAAMLHEKVWKHLEDLEKSDFADYWNI